jgi:stage V sporulation protein R
MKSVLQLIRKTSLFFQPQIRTKIMNEGWASCWHERLFLEDDRIRGNEVNYARVNAGVTAMPRVGLNPYALGMRLFQYIESSADKGRFSVEFERLVDAVGRKRFDTRTGTGRQAIFSVRENFSDFLFVNTFLDQDFVNEHRLFVAGRRLNREKGVWEYYVKSRKVEDYRQMIFDMLYHPPHVEIDESRQEDGALYLVHHFEGKPLIRDYIANTLIGVEFLWGGPVKLETSEPVPGDRGGEQTSPGLFAAAETDAKADREPSWERVRYTMKDRKLFREVLEEPAGEPAVSAGV